MKPVETRTESPFPAPRDLRLVAVAASIVFTAVLFRDAAANLWHRWGQQQELSHSYFIPLVSLYLIWVNRDAVRESLGRPSFAGLVIYVGALSLLLLGQLTSIFLFQHLGLVVAIAGLVAGFGGLSLLRTTAAPVAFLFFAVPPPYWVITVLSWKFQQMSSFLGVQVVEAMGIPVHLSGNIIDLGDYKLQVAEACSGLRYLFPFLSLGVMSAYMFSGAIWQRLLIVAATVPITIAMNSMRIAATAALVDAYGIEHAEGALHFFEGWVVFLFCLVALFALIALLARFSNPRVGPLEALTTPDLPVVKAKGAGRPLAVIFGSFALAAVLGFAATKYVTTDTLIIPDRKSFTGIPGEFGDWLQDVRPIDPTVAEVLGADDSIVVNLKSPEGDNYNVYLAYLNAQRDGRSWHSPRQCLPGGGWKIIAQDVVNTKSGDGRPFSYNRLIIKNGDYRQLVYYWYDQRGRKIANEFVMKFWLIVDAVFRKRSDGAMVRLITPIHNEGGAREADAKLQMMIGRVETFLPEYVPE
ncbi:MAG: VPLPA-CTERM-specific exosortase XrtD [Parvularculaceae bacterium]|nr:VPLPA-CTERM-specific exosortase XrtD [Parvularculaceae bacterium]